MFQEFDDAETVEDKCAQLAAMILAAKHVVVHTGAGISTQAGIPDFRYVFIDIQNQHRFFAFSKHKM